MKRLLLAALAASGLATGCYTQADVGYSAGYSTGYYAAGPDLYYLSPGVSVVAYSDYPTFYSDNAYWMYRDGLWYSSSYYGGGWAVSYNVPYGVRGIRQPGSYTRFQPGRGWVRMHNGGNGTYNAYRGYNPRGYNPRQGGYTPPPASARPNGGGRAWTAPAPAARSGGWNGGGRSGGGPVVRDHRHR
jgi:hypothetical protein